MVKKEFFLINYGDTEGCTDASNSDDRFEASEIAFASASRTGVASMASHSSAPKKMLRKVKPRNVVPDVSPTLIQSLLEPTNASVPNEPPSTALAEGEPEGAASREHEAGSGELASGSPDSSGHVGSAAPPVTRGSRGQLAYDTEQLDERTRRRLLGNRESARRAGERRRERTRCAEEALARCKAENEALRGHLAAALELIGALGLPPPHHSHHGMGMFLHGPPPPPPPFPR